MITATISTYNREKYLPQLLESIQRQTLDKKLFEVVLVNNNSPGNTGEIFHHFSQANPDISCRYFLETQQGLSYGRNRGIFEAQGTYITFLDDDAFLAPDYLEKIYRYFEANPNVAAIGSKILLHYESIIPDWENKYLNSLLGYFNLGETERDFPHNDYPRGSNMSFRMRVFQEVGNFNVNLGRVAGGLGGGEEKDMFKRIYARSGFQVKYIPDAVVYHAVPPERTTREFIRRQALGTGMSERIRVKNAGISAMLSRWGIELFKWMASLALFFLYMLKGKPAKGKMIVRFRFWVSQGLFSGKAV